MVAAAALPRVTRRIALVLAVAGMAGCTMAGCTAAGLPKIPLLAPGAETAADAAPAPSGPTETSLFASGTPTGVFTQVAHGALGCWFGGRGPLKASHVYRAEAEPPAKGGEAEIIIYQRDTSLRDQRGPKAYWISFVSEAAGVRVKATALKFEPKLAQAMARDVDTWAKGGGGCQLRAVVPPPAPQVVAKATKSAGQNKSASQSRSASQKKP